MKSRARAKSKAPVRPSILVFTEGAKTEPTYLKHWYRLHRDRAIVVIDDFHGGPLQLVERACQQKKADERDRKRQRGDPFDEYWCVFDVDEHAHLPRALELAGAGGINLAVSNPCIELWFTLHFRDQWSALDRKKAQDLSKGLLGCEKTPSAQALLKLVETHDLAVGRAHALDRKHLGDGSPAGANPSTGVWQLIRRVRGA